MPAQTPAARPDSRSSTVKLPVPKYTDKDDPERFFQRLRINYRYENVVSLFAYLLSACDGHGVAQDFLLTLAGAQDMTMDALETAFVTRFNTRILTRKAEARDTLLSGKLQMDVRRGVPEYTQRFLEKANEAGIVPGSPETDFVLIPLYQKGLSAALAPRCVIDLNRKPFESLNALTAHAAGEELQLRASGALRTPTLNFIDRAPRSDRTPQMKRNHGGWQKQYNKRSKSEAGRPQTPRAPPPPPMQGAQNGFGPQNAARPPRQQPRLHDPLGLTKIVGPNGRLLSHIEWQTFKAEGRCLGCGEVGHIAKECPKRR